jgi:hypothetical protein
MGIIDQYTKALLHMNESSFTDECGNSITKVSSPTYDNITKKFGSGSAYFNGSSGLYMPYSSDFVLGTSNFTFEAQFYCTSYATTKKTIIRQTKKNNANGYGTFAVVVNTSGKLELFLSSTGSSWNIAGSLAGTTTISLSTWNHVAFVRNGNKFTVYLNGVAEISVTSTSSLYTSTSNYIGIGYTLCSISQFFSGYIDEVRVSIGIARWESNFTPPVRQYYSDKYLIKQGEQYYSIKSDYYDSVTTHNYTPLTLGGGVTPNSTDIYTFGFDELDSLITSMTISSDTFIPMDKLSDSFEIKSYIVK